LSLNARSIACSRLSILGAAAVPLLAGSGTGVSAPVDELAVVEHPTEQLPPGQPPHGVQQGVGAQQLAQPIPGE
jgi:hypothetical protein